jgi:DNA polymerase-3 subunit alpha
MVTQKPWGVREKLTFEKSAVGFHLSGHLFDEAEAEVRKFVKTRLSDLTESRDPQWAAGIVRSERSIPTAKGKLNIFVLDDGSCSLEITADDAVFTRLRPLLREDQLVICLLKVQNDRRSGGLRMSLADALDLPAARCRFGKYLKITLGESNSAVLFKQLMSSLSQPGQVKSSDGLPVRLHLLLAQTEVDIQLGEKAHIHPTDEVLTALTELIPADDSMIIYE